MCRYYIKWLGGLEIYRDDELRLALKSKKSQVKDMLAVLHMKKDSQLTDDQIIEMIWINDNIENSQSALKNLAYLTRKALKEVDEIEEFVIRKNGRYIWNPEVETKTDTQEMEEYYKELTSVNTSDEEKLEKGRKIVSLYKGRLAENFDNNTWWFPISQYYNMIYINTVSIMCKLLEKLDTEDSYEEIIFVATTATHYDMSNEELYVHVFRALKAMDDKRGICDYYEAIGEIIYNKIGEGLCEEIKKIYTWAMQEPDFTFNDLEKLTENLRENLNTDEIKGAYFCQRDAFKNILHFIIRNSIREKNDVVITLLTITDLEEKLIEGDKLKEMDRLYDALKSLLRKNDVYVRYSVNQFLVLPYDCSKESISIVEKRVVEKFDRNKKHQELVLDVVSFSIEKKGYQLLY